VPRPEAIRIAWMDALPHCPTARETADTLRATAAALEGAGCRLERVSPPQFDVEEILATWGEINGFEMGAMTPTWIRVLIRHTTFLGLGRTRWTRGLRGGLSMNAGRYFQALATRDRIVSALDAFLAGFDAWMLPVSAVPAFPHMRSGKSLEVDGVPVPYTTAVGSYAAPFNLTGSPAVVVPAGHSAGGLPIGVQLVGARWNDDRLLAVAERVAEILGPFRPPPGV